MWSRGTPGNHPRRGTTLRVVHSEPAAAGRSPGNDRAASFRALGNAVMRRLGRRAALLGSRLKEQYDLVGQVVIKFQRPLVEHWLRTTSHLAGRRCPDQHHPAHAFRMQHGQYLGPLSAERPASKDEGVKAKCISQVDAILSQRPWGVVRSSRRLPEATIIEGDHSEGLGQCVQKCRVPDVQDAAEPHT